MECPNCHTDTRIEEIETHNPEPDRDYSELYLVCDTCNFQELYIPEDKEYDGEENI